MTPQEQAQLNKLLKEGVELAKKLKDTTSEASLTNFTGDLRTAELMVKSLRDEWEDYTNDIKGAREGFIRIVDEIRNMNSGVTKSKIAFNGLTNIAAQLQSHQEKITNLSGKELEKLKSKIGDKVNELKLAEKLTKEELDSLHQKQISGTLTNEELKRLTKVETAYNNISSQLANDLTFVDQINQSLDKEITKTKDIEKSLGISGALMRGMSKIPFLGDLPGMDAVLKDVESEVRKINDLRREEGKEPLSRTEALKITFSKMGGVIKDSLTDPLVVGLFILKQLYDIFVASDKATGDLAKNFNLSYSAANNLRSELTDIANSSNDVAVNTKGLQESMVAVGQALGSNARLNKEDLVTFTKLREQAGYTNEELVSMQRLTLATGGSLEKNSKTFLGTVARLNAQNKLAINAKQLFKDIANVSDAIKLSIGGTADKIAESAFKARQFGISLQQADQISQSLLDFESSINNQISAELITGKELNMEKARLLALNGDIAGASAEILKQVGGTAEFTKMNRIQQEALAKAVGMSRDDLAKSLVDREAAAKLGAKEGQSAQDAYNAAVKKYGVEKANQMLGDDALATQFQQQSVQERLLQTVEKLKEAFVSIVEPVMAIISPIVDILAPILTAISTTVGYIISGFKTMLPILAPIVAIMGVMWARAQSLAIMEAIGNIWQSLGGLPVVGPVLAIGAIAGAIGYIKSQSIKDGMIAPDGGLTVSGAKGTYKLDPNDHVIAGTDLGKRTPAAGGGGGQDLSPLLNEMKALRQEQAKSNSKPTVVENSMNGTKFGTSVAMNTYKTQ